MKLENVEIKLKVNPIFCMSLWDAIKLRIAGGNCKVAIEGIKEVTEFKKDQKSEV